MYSLLPHKQSGSGTKAGKFKDEIIPVEIVSKKGTVVFDTDEFIKHGATLESLSALRPAFDKNGTVTAGNASGLNDGAAAVIMMSAKKAERAGITSVARIKAYSSAGVDPSVMGMGRCLQHSSA
jgi:acetyl-CoA C-acetyltransferase